MSGTYRSARLPVRGLPTTGQFRQKSTVGGRLRKKKGRRGEERIPRPRAVLAHLSSPPAGRPRPRPLFLPRKETERLPTRGDRSRRPRDGEGAGAEKHGIRVQRGVQKVEESGGRLLGLVAVVVLSRRGGLPPLGFRLRLLGGVFSRLRRRFGGFGFLRSRLHLSSSNPTAKAETRRISNYFIYQCTQHVRLEPSNTILSTRSRILSRPISVRRNINAVHNYVPPEQCSTKYAQAWLDLQKIMILNNGNLSKLVERIFVLTSPISILTISYMVVSLLLRSSSSEHDDTAMFTMATARSWLKNCPIQSAIHYISHPRCISASQLLLQLSQKAPRVLLPVGFRSVRHPSVGFSAELQGEGEENSR
ncbi:hypothetical protein B296_00048697 [Ensete ventricosum]|uniref:Uncharacterized protein n=1 Tax=Ensete ventricosum TaxID=4639 RepID=A0A426X7D5_ENSVE|nr:hypothetical protein B296_00048697 [Ensete ventricosum]